MGTNFWNNSPANRPLSPCWNDGHGCTDRHANCHADCQRYKDWRTKLREDSKEEFENRQKHNMIEGAHKAAVTRSKSRRYK